MSTLLHHRTFLRHPEDEWVVFVHGAGGSSSIWYLQLREFSRHFNVLLLDLRGHGESQGPAFVRAGEAYDFDAIARDIIAVLDHQQIASAHFVGISLGTILIRTIAEIAPERVRSLVMGGAITRLNLRARFLVAGGNAVKRFVPFIWLYRLFAWIIMPRRRHREARSLFVNEARKLRQQEFLRWFRLTNEVGPVFRLYDDREAPVPTLYVMGDEDHMFLPHVRQLVAQQREWSTLEVVRDSGHVVNVDQAERFNALVTAFIRGVGRVQLRA